MTKHLGLARPGLAHTAQSVCGRTSSHAIATLTALTLLLGAGAAQAAHVNVTRTPHPRRVVATQEPLPTQSARSRNSRSKSRLAAERASARTIAKKPISRASARQASLAAKHEAPAAKPSARDRRHKAAQQDAPPVEMTRASLRRAPRRNAHHEATHQLAVAHATPAPNKHRLTSDDFLRASAGTSDPTADSTPASVVITAAASKPQTIKHSAVVAHVESADPYAPRPATANDSAPTNDELAYLAHPSHEELSEEVAVPMVLPGLYRNGRLIVPAPLKGTHEILVHQNLMADDEGLERIQDDDDLARLRAAHQLINFPESASLHVNPELAENRKCARPWTVHFATDIARQFYARFHQPLQVNSAARTIAYQVRLQRVNGNAAGIGGDVASPHLTGQAIDFGKSGMSIAEIAWMRAYLKPLMDNGKLDVEEEFQQACFHISVYRNYLPYGPKRPKTELATLHSPKAAPTAQRLDRDE